MSEPIIEREVRRTALFSKLERLAVPISFIPAILYTDLLTSDGLAQKILTVLFTACYVAATEIVCRKENRSPETWVWLGCLICTLAGLVLDLNHVWEEVSWLFLHLFALYYYLIRSNRLYEGETGRFILMDGINAAFVFPFRYFIYRILCIVDIAREKHSTRKEGRKRSWQVWVIVAAVLLAILLFMGAWKLLAKADDTWMALLGDLSLDLDLEDFLEILLHVILSIPLGAYFYGLIIGSRRQIPEVLHARAGKVERAFGVFRKVPIRVWTVASCAFILLYALFFAIHSSYLFGAFFHRLPEEFTVAEYARKGFFELCAVVTLNFGFMGIIGLTGNRKMREDTVSKVTNSVLLIESVLFSAIAFSKLAMYIGCYGFTPLRLQSTWLVIVIFAACVLSLITLWTGKKTMRWWILFSAVTMALLCLY